MFHALRTALPVRNRNNLQDPYYPSRYLRRDLVTWMINNRRYVMKVKGEYLRSTYGVEAGEAGLLSYSQYLRKLLDVTFYGDSAVLHSFSKQHECRITVLTCPTFRETRFRHNKPLQEVDFVLVYNANNHYSGAGR